jgi:cytochrome c oxidase subunit II
MIARTVVRLWPAAGSILLLAGCSGNQSALDPAGPHAARIESLWWLFFWVCAVVYVVVIAGLFVGLRRGAGRNAPETTPDPTGERRRVGVIAAAVAATALILFLFTGASYLTDRAMATGGAGDPSAIHITLTGHQWWWEVTYDDPVPVRQITTANEIHIPRGRAISIALRSPDVIHSLWIPNLDGKKDLIPGRDNIIAFRADRIGTYRGQCAEFCGAQHANMALLMVVESGDDFRRWQEEQRAPAAEPTSDEARHGRDVLLSSSCVLCHTVHGTAAGGRTGPDLTHVASRATLAAATIPNTPGHMAAWIVDPQRIKSGVRMPTNGLSPPDLQALLAYLRDLK